MKWSDEHKKKMSDAAKERWRKAKAAGQKTLKTLKEQPVPVLAEPHTVKHDVPAGEARESTQMLETTVGDERPTDSRGGLVLSRSDQKFWSWRPGYYEFNREGEWDHKCRNCGEAFKTRLEFNNFCSPNCKNEWTGSRKTRGA